MLSALPGNAIEAQLIQSGASADTIVERQAAAGLFDPLPIRYLRFWGAALRGDLGESLISREPVTQVIGRSLGPTITLALSALLVAVPTGIILGILSALGMGLITTLSSALTSLALSTPVYWTGTLVIYLFAVQMGVLPASGSGSFRHLILPVMVLAFHTAGAIAHVTRVNVQAVLHEDFTRTARAKGLHEHQVITRHVLRVGLLPIVSVIALQAGFLLGGTVITESLFVRPGMGRILLDATRQQDYPIVLGIVMLAALTYTLINLVADTLTMLLDPRIVL
jgi:ABC-type dipeptide/oligopeptide/nickel transport system permease component